MSQTADERVVREIDLSTIGVDLSPIIGYLASSSAPFASSLLYSSGEKRKYEDPSQRLSQFRAIVDHDLFNLADSIVQQISNADSNMNFSLVRNDVTQIKYVAGGFFKAHQDFLSLTSNFIEEFTLIVCITSEEIASTSIGGRTIIHWGNKENSLKTAYQATTTPGHALLFRKDLYHEGEVLEKGEKIILTMNLWGTRVEKSGQVLHVRFPIKNNCSGENGGGGGSSSSSSSNSSSSSSSSSSSEQTADQAFRLSAQSPSYAIAVENCIGSMLQTHCEFTTRQQQTGTNDYIPPVIVYNCMDVSYEAFGTVFKILTRQRVTEMEIFTNQQVLDYFGPFDFRRILMDLAAETPSPGKKEEVRSGKSDVEDEEDMSDGKEMTGNTDGVQKEVRSSESDDSEEEFDKTDETTAGNSILFQDRVIVCESPERTTVVNAIAREFDLPYLKFKIVFVEGNWVYTDGDACCGNARFEQNAGDADDLKDIPLSMIWLSVGDHDNIFQSTSVLSMIGSWKEIPDSSMQSVVDYLENQQNEERTEAETEFKPLEVSVLNPNKLLEDNLSAIGNGRGTFSVLEFNNQPVTYLPGSSTEDENSSSTALFHIDSEGKTCFSKSEAERATEYLVHLDLAGRVKESINSMRFQLPQQSTTSSQVGFFCNESVYGKCNVLSVSGIVRMDESPPSPSYQKHLHVWPSQQQSDDVFESVNGIKRYVHDWEAQSGSYVNAEDDTVDKLRGR